MLNSISNYDSCQCTRTSGKGIKRLDLSDNAFLDKENMEPLSPMKTEDMSFYENDSPRAMECSGTSPSHCYRHTKTEPVEDFDLNSQDSGYGTTYNTNLERFTSYVSPSRSSRVSFGSLGSHEDDFLESMSDFEPIDENLPLSFKTLINGELSALTENTNCQLSPQDVSIRPLFRRALSLQHDSNTPNRRVRSCLFRGEDVRPFKRPEPPTEPENTPTNIKRTRILMDTETFPPRPLLKRTFSATEESIKCAVQRSAEEELIGDFSRTYSLPLTQGRHRDLKSITSSTLAGLMRGEYADVVDSFKVIDCRYPYEFNGGHIEGAINIYTKDQCLELLQQQSATATDNKRHILIFHCEFSSERGPNLFRYLRQQDRSRNEAAYPSLQYPEIYLLEGGYKHFFTEYSHMCIPVAYKQMLHPEHEEDLRYFRNKSKTWNADSRQRSHRGNLKRLGL
ncbi:hypothetical protein HHI36_023317 [Cryptolaemus montrouzieri]|uniref:protein-tyrosine-phosphatase n=1 Tax=Cryptolaemus montrouzieri TaxID=559131 RepID=A0ABD2PG98_9CUCU